MNLNLPTKQTLYHKLASIIIYFILTDSIDKINPD